jgi:hypothetical protein
LNFMGVGEAGVLRLAAIAAADNLRARGSAQRQSLTVKFGGLAIDSFALQGRANPRRIAGVRQWSGNQPQFHGPGPVSVTDTRQRAQVCEHGTMHAAQIRPPRLQPDHGGFAPEIDREFGA